MDQIESISADDPIERVGDVQSRATSRRCRLVPPAITPLRVSDIGAGLVGQFRETGRDEFRTNLVSFLDAECAGSYTSFRRALGACLLELQSETDGDRTDVLIPAFCSSDFPEAIEGVGLNALRYDIDGETMSIDTESIEELPGEDALALVVVNVLGYGSSMDRIADYCEERDIYLLEALGYALGTEYGSGRLGTFGDCAVLNFQQGKPIPTGGGAVVSQNPSLEFADEGRPAVDSNAGMLLGYKVFSHPQMYSLYSRATELIDQYGVLDDRITTHPESKLGVTYSPPFATMSNFQGTVAGRVFDRLEEYRRQRAQTARFYADELSDCPHVHHVRPVEGLSNHQYIRYPLVVDSPELRAEMREALSEAGVEATTLYDWPPLGPERFPSASRLQRGIMTLPTHPYVDQNDRRLVVETIENVAREFDEY